MYWHWHSIHNSFETYWKGLLSHDFQENATYREACVTGREFAEHGSRLVNLKKKNEVAILISNEALTALKWFPIQMSEFGNGSYCYNDIVRWLYDALYKMNVECDFVWPESEKLEQYKAIVVPALYAAPDALLKKLNAFVEKGGSLLATFKTAFTNESVKVSQEVQPHILGTCLGIVYHQFTIPQNTGLKGTLVEGRTDTSAEWFMELIETEGAEVLASYDHYNWGKYAAITRNVYGKGNALYVGTKVDNTTLNTLLDEWLRQADVEVPEEKYPLIIRKGTNDYGKKVRYYLNYSNEEQKAAYQHGEGTELLTGEHVVCREVLHVAPWNLKIIEEF